MFALLGPSFVGQSRFELHVSQHVAEGTEAGPALLGAGKRDELQPDLRSKCGTRTMMPADGREKLEAIVGRIMERRLVPFLGAGVSFPCKNPCGSQGNPFHLTGQMTRALCWGIDARSAPEPLQEAVRAGRSDGGAVESIGLAEAAELLMTQLGQAGCQKPAWEVVALLRVPDFRKLAPTQAHRHIAFLAREGLIEEVFTTNYDCALERAVAEARGRELQLFG